MECVHWYNLSMEFDAVRDYFTAQLPLKLNAQQHFGLLRTVFILVFASTIVIHLLAKQQETLLDLLIHATIIGLVYTVAVGLATAFIYSLRKATRFISVWHVWAASLAGFFIGYYVLPIEDWVAGLQWFDSKDRLDSFGILQLAPVWLLVTYLIIQPYLNERLRSELTRLREINVLLEDRGACAAPNGQIVGFKSGKTKFSLDAATIRNIVVDDHYCYLHYQDDNTYSKRDLAMPLRDVLTLLPSSFVQVHRSHIVNLQYIASIVRRNRRIFVILDGGFEVPVSRHRMEQVLPLLRQRVSGSESGARVS